MHFSPFIVVILALFLHVFFPWSPLLIEETFLGSSTFYPYMDKNLPIQQRVNDLLGRMTLEEKIGQMNLVNEFHGGEKEIMTRHTGAFFNLMGDTAAHAIRVNRKTRLKIPLLLGIDAIHGHSFFKYSTIFPTQLGMAQSWDPDLIRKIGTITAYEMRFTGPVWTYSPVVCIARDLRWGRVGETFGEDPYLIGLFASALIKGLQGDQLSADPDRVMACAKHFAGYSETVGGLDSSETELSRRTLLSFFLPQFKKCAEAGVGSFMSGYQSIDGVPAVANEWILRDLLKNEWEYDGFVVSDYNSVGSLVRSQQFAETQMEASIAQTVAGNDMVMMTHFFVEEAIMAVRKGKLSMNFVDDSVKRILEAKFKMGLFEDERMPDIGQSLKRNCKKEHRDLALEAAIKSLVLLKNDGILPLNKEKIALLGPNADMPSRQLGDWVMGTMHGGSSSYDRNMTVTIRDALKEKLGDDLNYSLGCSVDDEDKGKIALALSIAKEADVIIIVVGDSIRLFGECRSTATLELMGTQNRLISKISELGKPFIINILSSKPLILPPEADKASAIIQQFSPGMLGGKAFVKVIYGEEEPRGRLTISIPQHVGQHPIYYHKLRGVHSDSYVDLNKTNKPKYPFGYGLTYTRFKYLNATLDRQIYLHNDVLKVSVVIENIGKRKGTEIIQCYVSDLLTSVVWVDYELKGFAAIELQPGETKVAQINIPISECSIVNKCGKRVVENGKFRVLIGKSSNDIQKTLDFFVR